MWAERNNNNIKKNQQLKIKGKERNTETIKKTFFFQHWIFHHICSCGSVIHTSTCTHKFSFCCARPFCFSYVVILTKLLLSFALYRVCALCVRLHFSFLSHFTFGYPSPSIHFYTFFLYKCAKHMHFFPCPHTRMCHSCRSTVYRAIKANENIRRNKKAATTALPFQKKSVRVKSSQQCIDYWYCCMLRNRIYYSYCIAATFESKLKRMSVCAVISGEKNKHTHLHRKLGIFPILIPIFCIETMNVNPFAVLFLSFRVPLLSSMRFTLDCVIKNSKVISYTP